ncbi:MAG: HesA/MoeB/ThiF family protein [Candidatus Bathyarchaeota archaeon]
MKKIATSESTKHIELSKEEQEYYSRQIVMTEMGYNAQLKLKQSKVCLLGVGGLGSPAAMQLASIGVGHLRIVDRDIVELTNLHRQHLYGVEDIDYPKVEAAAKRLRQLNPYIEVEPLPISVNNETAENLVKEMDVVVDGLDNMKARYEINRACIKHKIPYIFGAAITTTGNVSTIIPDETVCLECFYGNLNDKNLPKCGVVGVHPSIINIIASIEVSEAIRIITGRKPRLTNKLLYFDLDELEINEIQLSKIKECPVCGENQTKPMLSLDHELIEEICGRKGKKVFLYIPKHQLNLDFNNIKNYYDEKGIKAKVESELGLTYELNEIKASFLKSGIIILEGIKEKDEAYKFFEEFTE